MAVRRFGIITEADARLVEPGSTVELERGGHVTPLAQDTLRARRVTVVPAGSVDPAVPADLAPVFPVTRVVIGCDHSGIDLKKLLVDKLRRAAIAVNDVGTDTKDAVDYPDIASTVARAVTRKEADAGIVIDGAGLGSAIAANKVKGARAAMCTTPTLARYAREHNGANVLALGATLVSATEAVEIVEMFLTTPTKEPRYLRRLLKVRRLEEMF
ncbi:MAG TPA: RpiB/LacA/LacB family sugar-phosphate isomerase [Vicinamibacterales bacterium]|nr:RpiB/LacA/LacB family sugar-phosphate isomerase [Vicinamibacterales bacterium]